MTDQHFDIIIIGAGACGLMAAFELGKAAKKILILEARDRTGGRIHTIDKGKFSIPVETGAEFIHGDLPLTISLLDQANLHYQLIGGELWRVERGLLAQEDNFNEGADIMIPRLETLQKDITVAEFFEKFFRDPLYENFISEVRGYVEGYDAADINRASAFALRDEWAGGDMENQYRPLYGYKPMIGFLEKMIQNSETAIYFNTLVKKIAINGDVAVAHTADSEFTASKIIVTVPLGILQSEDSVAGISIPALPESHRLALKQLGFGSVIKMVFEFSSPVWEEAPIDNSEHKSLENLGWLFSGEEIPTWWTQAPRRVPIITGWLAGPDAHALRTAPDHDIIKKGIHSLANILKIDDLTLREKLVASEVFNWAADPFTMGAYAYSTPQTVEALATLHEPVENRIYFAGEAFHDGPQMGTVEGALASGKEIAERLR